MRYTELIAFDANSQRTKDSNGYLRVATSHITKETVNPYYGRDIPGWRNLGLDPNKIYMGYREGAALKKAVPSFNGLPLLLGHYLDSAENPQKYHRVGSLGTDAVFNAPYIDNSLIVTDAKAIRMIESGEAKEISAAYRYTPIMQSGEFEGQKYDFIMRDIEANHIALVKEGRAGHDVVVADEMPGGLGGRKVRQPSGPIDAVLMAARKMRRNPGMACDDAIDSLFPKMSGKTRRKVSELLSMVADSGFAKDGGDVNMGTRRIMRKRGLATDSKAARAFDAGREYMRNKLAKAYEEDEDDVDFEDLPSKKRIDGIGDDEDEFVPVKKKKKFPPVNEDEDEEEDLDAEDEDEEEDLDAEDEDEEEDLDAEDEDEEEDLDAEDEDEEEAPFPPIKKKKKKFSVGEDDEDVPDDPAFKAGMEFEQEAHDRRMAHDEQIRRRVTRHLRKMYKAAEDCKGVIGRVVDPYAYDSAGDIYKMALKANGVRTKGVHPSAYPEMLRMVKKQKSASLARNAYRSSYAMDSKGSSSLKAVFDGLDSIRK